MSGSLISNLQLDLRSDFRLQRYDMFLIKKCVSVNKVSGVGVRGWGQGSGVGVRVRGLGSGSGVKGSGSGVWRQGIWVRVKDVFLISAKKKVGPGVRPGSPKTLKLHNCKKYCYLPVIIYNKTIL